MSDFHDFAVYNRAAERWTATPLPWPIARNGGMIIGPIRDGAVVLGLRCAQACPTEEQLGDTAELVVLASTSPGRLREVAIDGRKSITVPVQTLLSRTQFGKDEATFVAYSSSGVTVVRATTTGATAEQIEGSFQQVCTSADGSITALERVADDTPDAVPFVPPPSNAPPDAPRPMALRIVRGENLATLVSVEASSTAAAILADQLTLASSCLDGVLAIVGETGAAEYRNGDWLSLESDLSGARMLAATGVSADPLPDGTSIVVTGTGSLERSADGLWRRRPADAGQTVAMGRDVFTYRPERKEADNLDTEMKEPSE